MTDADDVTPQDAIEVYREHVTVIAEIKRSQWQITGRDGGGVPDNGDLVTVPTGPDPQYAESALGIVKCHPFNGFRQDLTGRLLGPACLCHDPFFAFS